MTTEVQAAAGKPDLSLDRETVLIGGTWEGTTSDRIIDVVNPATEQIIARVREASPADVGRAVSVARLAFDQGPWPRSMPEARARVLEALADRLDARSDELARLNTMEVGCPLLFSYAGIAVSTGILRYYAGQARSFSDRSDRARPDGGMTRILREPVGVVGAIAPWNGPLSTAALKLGPALAVGCTVILKPAPETPLVTFVFGDIVADLVDEGLLPPGVISMFPAGREVGEVLVRNNGVDKITFTGSTGAGRRIMALAAERIGRVTLELGGKSAAIIDDDIPVETVLQSLVMGGCGYSGQMCMALTRVLVSQARHDEFVEAMGHAMAELPIGDPLAAGTLIGPLAMNRQRERVEGYLALALEEGARFAVGGGRPNGLDRGYYIEPTLVAGVTNDMRIAQEEIFGPVISVITYTDLDDAVGIANDSPYGLAGSVYTSDVEKGFEIARRVRTGTFSVNGAVLDPTVPFGGYKQSGLGREGGPEGLDPFLEYKSVHMPVVGGRVDQPLVG